MKISIKIIFILCTAFELSCFAQINNLSNVPSKKQPNVILIIADDLGYADIGSYGSSFYDTPKIDELANNGTRFTNGYSNCPVCSPSRASFQTGKYPLKTGITDWIKGRKEQVGTTTNDRWIVPDTEYDLKLSETTIAEALKQNGYNTAFLGKWHLGETAEFYPENQGYDINIGGWSAGGPQHSKGVNGYFSPYGNPRLKDGPAGEYLPERLTNEAIAILKSKKDKPLFLCLSYYLVHTKLQAKADEVAQYEQKRKKIRIKEDQEFSPSEPWMQTATGNSKNYKERIKQGNPIYAAMVKALDDNVGRLIDYLKEAGTYDDTMIVFVSDNGGLSTAEGSSTSNLPLAKGKGWMYEGGIRVPFIIKKPQSKKGNVNPIPVSGVDIFPTILAYASKSEYTATLDGLNLKPVLDEGKKIGERPIFWHYPHYSNQGGNPSSAIRLGDFKLIHDLELDKYELFNLKRDIGETKNLITVLPKKAAELTNLLNDWIAKNYNKNLQINPKWNKDNLK